MCAPSLSRAHDCGVCPLDAHALTNPGAAQPKPGVVVAAIRGAVSGERCDARVAAVKRSRDTTGSSQLGWPGVPSRPDRSLLEVIAACSVCVRRAVRTRPEWLDPTPTRSEPMRISADPVFQQRIGKSGTLLLS